MSASLSEEEKQSKIVNITTDAGMIAVGLVSDVLMMVGFELAGPIGGIITAVIITGKQIYYATIEVEHAEKFVKLTGWERFTEGFSAFFTGSVTDETANEAKMAEVLQKYINSFLGDQQGLKNCKVSVFPSVDFKITDTVKATLVHNNNENIKGRIGFPIPPIFQSSANSYENMLEKTVAPEKQANGEQRVFLGLKPNSVEPQKLKVSPSNNYTVDSWPTLMEDCKTISVLKDYTNNEKYQNEVEIASEKITWISYNDITSEDGYKKHIAEGESYSSNMISMLNPNNQSTNQCVLTDADKSFKFATSRQNETLILHHNKQNSGNSTMFDVTGPENAKTIAYINDGSIGRINAKGGGLIEIAGLGEFEKVFNLTNATNTIDGKYGKLELNGFGVITSKSNSTFNSYGGSAKYIIMADGTVNIFNGSSIERVELSEGNAVINAKEVASLPIIILPKSENSTIELNLNENIDHLNIQAGNMEDVSSFQNLEQSSQNGTSYKFSVGPNQIQVNNIRSDLELRIQAPEGTFVSNFNQPNKGSIFFKPEEGSFFPAYREKMENVKIGNFTTNAFGVCGSGENKTQVILLKTDNETINPSEKDITKACIEIGGKNNAVVIKPGLSYEIDVKNGTTDKFLLGFGFLKEKQANLTQSLNRTRDDLEQIIKDGNGTVIASIKLNNYFNSSYVAQNDFNGQITLIEKSDPISETVDLTEGIWDIEIDAANPETDDKITEIRSGDILNGKYTQINFKSHLKSSKLIEITKYEVNLFFITEGKKRIYAITDFDKILQHRKENPDYVLNFKESGMMFSDVSMISNNYDKIEPMMDFITREVASSLVYYDINKALENASKLELYHNFYGLQKEGYLQLNDFKLSPQGFQLVTSSEHDTNNYSSEKDLIINIVVPTTGETKQIIIKGYISSFKENFRNDVTLKFGVNHINLTIPPSIQDSFSKDIQNKTLLVGDFLEKAFKSEEAMRALYVPVEINTTTAELTTSIESSTTTNIVKSEKDKIDELLNILHTIPDEILKSIEDAVQTIESFFESKFKDLALITTSTSSTTTKSEYDKMVEFLHALHEIQNEALQPIENAIKTIDDFFKNLIQNTQSNLTTTITKTTPTISPSIKKKQNRYNLSEQEQEMLKMMQKGKPEDKIKKLSEGHERRIKEISALKTGGACTAILSNEKLARKAGCSTEERRRIMIQEETEKYFSEYNSIINGDDLHQSNKKMGESGKIGLLKKRETGNIPDEEENLSSDLNKNNKQDESIIADVSETLDSMAKNEEYYSKEANINLIFNSANKKHEDALNYIENHYDATEEKIIKDNNTHKTHLLNIPKDGKTSNASSVSNPGVAVNNVTHYNETEKANSIGEIATGVATFVGAAVGAGVGVLLGSSVAHKFISKTPKPQPKPKKPNKIYKGDPSQKQGTKVLTQVEEQLGLISNTIEKSNPELQEHIFKAKETTPTKEYTALGLEQEETQEEKFKKLKIAIKRTAGGAIGGLIGAGTAILINYCKNIIIQQKLHLTPSL